MKVQRVNLNDNKYRYILLDDDYNVVVPVKNFLKFLDNTDKSENTIKNYAHHLKLYFEYLKEIGFNYDEIYQQSNGIEVISNFIAWLKNPNYIKKNIVFLEPQESIRSNKTVNLILNTVLGFYDYLARTDDLKNLDVYKETISISSYKGFLYELLHNKENIKTNIFKLKEYRKQIKIINEEQYKDFFKHCTSYRDKLIISLMYEGGLRIGEVLGLFLEDFDVRQNKVTIKYRENLKNHVKVKNRAEGEILLPSYVFKLFANYLIEEFKDIDSNYVFVNLHGKNRGEPMQYITVKKMFEKVSLKMGQTITPHMLRHTHATQLIEAGEYEPIEVKERLRHKHVQTTIDTYIHLSDKHLQKKYKDFLKNIERSELNE